MCAMGILLALMERTKSKRGQVVNTDMASNFHSSANHEVDGVTSRRFLDYATSPVFR